MRILRKNISITISLFGFRILGIPSSISCHCDSVHLVARTAWKHYSNLSASENYSRVISIVAYPLSTSGNSSLSVKIISTSSNLSPTSFFSVPFGTVCLAYVPVSFSLSTVHLPRTFVYPRVLRCTFYINLCRGTARSERDSSTPAYSG